MRNVHVQYAPSLRQYNSYKSGRKKPWFHHASYQGRPEYNGPETSLATIFAQMDRNQGRSYADLVLNPDPLTEEQKFHESWDIYETSLPFSHPFNIRKRQAAALVKLRSIEKTKRLERKELRKQQYYQERNRITQLKWKMIKVKDYYQHLAEEYHIQNRKPVGLKLQAPVNVYKKK